MSTTSTGEGSDLSTGMGILFGLLVAAAAIVTMLTEGLIHSLGFGAAVLSGAVLIVSLHVYE